LQTRRFAKSVEGSNSSLAHRLENNKVVYVFNQMQLATVVCNTWSQSLGTKRGFGVWGFWYIYSPTLFRTSHT